MPVIDFLHNIRTAHNVVFHHLVPATGRPAPGSERQTADRERLRRAVPLWLTPATVSDFNCTDFAYLPPDRCTTLAVDVATLRRVAEGIGDRAATDQELDAGLGVMSRIVEVLGDAVSDTEGGRLLAALLLEGDPLPEFVLGLDYTFDADATGDPAVWVWVILDDTLEPESAAFMDFARAFPNRVRKALRVVQSERLAYVRYRPLSDARLLLQGAV